SGNLELLQEWLRRLQEAKQGPRTLPLLSEVCVRWQKREDTRTVVIPVLETLVQANLEQNKWAAAFPLVRDLLARPGSEAEVERRLRWLLTVGDQALKEGNSAETLHAVQEAQAFLSRNGQIAAEFAQLEKRARGGP